MDNQELDLNKDWKFLSIIQFANVFKNVLGIESISTYEMSFSLKNPDIEPLCLNVLLKLLMKKTLFKANSRIGENYEVSKLNEILIKKINYLYKTYLRYLKRAYSLTEPSRIFDIIKQDTETYKAKNDLFKMTSSNLMDKSYDDLDLKTLMVVNFFREVGGFNPLQKVLTKEKVEQLLNQKEGNELEMIEMTTAAVNNSNSNDIVIEDYLEFSELDLRKKIDFLYFFCNYAITFSGRAPFFKEELTKTTDEAIKENKKIVPIGMDVDGINYYTFPLNRECKIFKEVKPNGFELCVKDYSELEKLIENETQYLFINKIKNKLLQYKENDEEEHKKEQGLLRKQEAFEKAKKLSSFNVNEVSKYPSNDYLLMNISSHVITRNQLNQITKNNTNSLNANNTKVHELTEEEKHKQKVEKDNLERERRMEKRNRRQEKMKIKETQRNNAYHNNNNRFRGSSSNNNYTNRKRKRTKRRSSSSEEEYGASSDKSSSYINEDEMRLESDNEIEDDNGNGNYNNYINTRNNSNNKYYDPNKQRDNYAYNTNHNTAPHNNNNRDNEDNDSYADNNNKNNNDYSVYGNNNINYQNEMRNEDESSNDIVNEGYLIYRYCNNQIELEGNWFVTNDPYVKERVSYLYTNSNKTKDYVVSKDNVIIDSEDIKLKMSKYALNPSMPNTMTSINIHSHPITSVVSNYRMKICSANLFECITINQLGIFESCLDYLSGDYAGYFMYYGKTIEDHFKLNFVMEDSLVNISGDGMNNLGSFSINGYMNFYKSKEILLEKNKIDELYIKLAEFKMTKRYIDFNPTENDKVIKSYNHRRKKNDSDFDY